MTVNEAAKLLEVKPVTVYALCAAGKIAHERIGLGRGTIRIRPDDLEAYRKGARVEVAGASPIAVKRRRPAGLKHWMRGER